MKKKAHLIVSVSFIFILLFLNGCTSEKTNNKLRIGEAMKEERLEGAFLTLDEVLKLMQEGVKLKVIYAIDTSNGADAILAKQTNLDTFIDSTLLQEVH